MNNENMEVDQSAAPGNVASFQKEQLEDKDETSGSSANVPQKKKKRYSPMWNHYTIIVDDSDAKNEWANCNYCSKKYPIYGKSNGSTSNLIRHLKHAHPGAVIVPVSEEIEIIEFSQERYREALTKWIVICNQPFTEVEQESFLEMIAILNPAAITISSTTVKRDIIAKFEEKVKEMVAYLKEVPGKLSFTIDAWTSKNVLPFMAIRAHWINSEWVYETVLLDFWHIEGSHKGTNFGEIFLKCLERFEIPLSKVLALTMDNVSSNDTLMEFLQKRGVEIGVEFSVQEHRVRCILHILNLIVQDILECLKISLNDDKDNLIEDVDENPGPMADAAENGIRKLSKYDAETEVKSSVIPYIGTLLNPAVKLNYFKEHFNKTQHKGIQKTISELFERNYANNEKTETAESPGENDDEFFLHMFKRGKTTKQLKEFQQYISAPLSNAKVNVLDFWKAQKEEFPHLSNMARDYLAVQSSSVSVEREFSGGVDLVTPTRCSLNAQTIRACIFLKSWYKSEKIHVQK
ncbi:putative AC transposase [Pseudolycoriella hygida]|uniref:AC transposase n=1 Tax=Pseudolycoriella hygida TaxID=35572 RepID=A0A9Q0N762_9DIPT|nr:putative AC transposase [Pseudolycoriella hygida]